MGLTNSESHRYARHIVLKGMGATGQQKLKAANVLIVGAGGLGSPAIAYLTAAGVGRISIADHDHVSISNLQRQIVHTQGSLNTNKAISAKTFANALNPEICITALDQPINAHTPDTFMADFDCVLDGTDRFSSRACIAQLAEQNRVSLISGAVSMFDGQATVFSPHLNMANGEANPRFIDLYPETPEDDSLPACEEAGILGATTGVIGTLMAMEAIKLITGIGKPLWGRLMLYDGRNAQFSELKYKRRDC